MKHKPLHIAMLVDAWFPSEIRPDGIIGGGQVHVRELSHELKKSHGYSIDLYYPSKTNILFRAIWTFAGLKRLLRTHHQKPYDLIHAHGFACAFTGKLASLILKIPIIHTVHGSHMMDQDKTHPKTWLETFLLTKISYDAQITVSDNFKKYKNINQSVITIPNGVNIEDFDKIKVKKNQTPSLIWVGRDDPVKGIEYLKKAIKKIRLKIPNLSVELVTNGRLTGQELIKAYKKAHVFVLPSLAEGQPITLLEAWAAKLPVVVTNVGDNNKMIKDGKNGLLVEAGNVKQLADAVTRILRAKVSDKRMGEAGYHLAKTRFSWEIVAEKTIQVYYQVLETSESHGYLKRLATKISILHNK